MDIHETLALLCFLIQTQVFPAARVVFKRSGVEVRGGGGDDLSPDICSTASC